MSGARLLKLTGLNVALCVLVGPLVGTAVFLAPAVRDLPRDATLPWTLLASCLFGLAASAPFGVVAGLAATGMCLALARPPWRPSGRTAWIVLGGVAGTVGGALYPLFLCLIGLCASDDVTAWLVWFGSVGAAGGAPTGVLIGWNAARTFGRV